MEEGFLVPGASDGGETARAVLEYAVLLAVKQRETEAFERHMTQLAAYYADYRDVLAPSEKEAHMVSLHLLHVLTRDSDYPAPFHMLLETLPAAVLANPQVAAVVELEQLLNDGRYANVIEMTSQLAADASSYEAYFANKLRDAVKADRLGRAKGK